MLVAPSPTYDIGAAVDAGQRERRGCDAVLVVVLVILVVDAVVAHRGCTPNRRRRSQRIDLGQ